MKNSSDFIYTQHRYRGKLKPEYLEFNEKLQEFAQCVYYVCCLQTKGKLSPEATYQKIDGLWQQLTSAKNQFDMSKGYPQNESGNSED
jgi:hypothetical protein